MPKRIFFAIILMATSFVSTGNNLVFSTGVDTLEQEVSGKVIHEAYQQIALKVDILSYPNMRSLMKSNNGEVDGELARISHINQRFKNLLQVSDWESLREYELVCVRGLLFVEQNLSQRNIPCYQVSTYSQAINLLKIGRFDIAVLPEITAISIIKKNNAKNVYIQGNRLIRVDLFHYLHKKNIHILPKITAVLQKMKTRGRIEEIRTEYTLQQSSKAASVEN